MENIQIVIPRSFNIDQEEFITAWNANAELAKIGVIRQPERQRQPKFSFEAIVIEIMVGIGVSVSSNLIYDALKKVLTKQQFKLTKQEDKDRNQVYIVENDDER